MVIDLAIIVVSTNECDWVLQLLPTLERRLGDISVDVIIVDNESSDGLAERVSQTHPKVRIVPSRNHGFGHANNRAVMDSNARYVLLLNPDTEIADGAFDALVRHMDAAPEVGLAGCRQVDPQGSLWPTMRRFPSAWRQAAEALGAERLPAALRVLGHRELRMERYSHEFDLDWTSGSFMLIRRTALEAVGLLDERFFIYSEEVDLARRIREAGWKVRHLPHMEIVHHAGKKGFTPRAEAQYAWSSKFYARKHMSRCQRLAFLGALILRALIRLALYQLASESDEGQAVASVRAFLDVLVHAEAAPPYQPPPPVALRDRGAEPAADR